MDIIFLVGRILLGGYFLMGAFQHLFKTNSLVGYAQSKGVPSPRNAVIVTGILLLFGGYSILTGVRVASGVWALVVFFIIVSFKMHAFWKEEGDARMMDKIQFMKNMAILGAVLMLLAIPTPWPLSLGI